MIFLPFLNPNTEVFFLVLLIKFNRRMALLNMRVFGIRESGMVSSDLAVRKL